jgi:hypothetical protein
MTTYAPYFSCFQVGIHLIQFYFLKKQLYIQYQCLNQEFLSTITKKCTMNKNIPDICPQSITEKSSNLNENVWCDGSTMNITCKNDQVIDIICSFYGIHPSLKTCNIPTLANRPVCYYASSKLRLKQVCNQQSSCSVSNFNMVFKDACAGLDKALFVQWKCV